MAWCFGGIVCIVLLLVGYSLMRVSHECSELEEKDSLKKFFEGKDR